MVKLSILIPTFNDECLTLVKTLDIQCRKEKIQYEIIVADDGSTAGDVLAVNSKVAKMENCRYVPNKENRGRAAIRNQLGRLARYSWLLFVDSDMTVVRSDFIHSYAIMAQSLTGQPQVVYGGYCVPAQEGLDGNLRYRYERSCQDAHTPEKRTAMPYSDFHTSNFMIHRDDFLAHPLDEHYRHYGYEDVAYGQTLKEAGITIKHADNPVGFCRFEGNAQFVAKTEEGLATLAEFRSELNGYSRLISIVGKLEQYRVKKLVTNILSPSLSTLRKNLTGDNPSLLAFKFYKLGYLLKLLEKAGKGIKRP